jgi:3',5'-cyclic AMP phosphodiesterase CpdA
MTVFRLIHITDLHISIPPEPNDGHPWRRWANPYALEAVADFLFEHRDTADLVLITGDIADDGIQRNLDTAYQYIATPATDGWHARLPFRPTLDSGKQSGPPFLILPGNHDRFRTVARLPGGTVFDETFKAYWHNGSGGVQSVLLPPEGRHRACPNSG